MKKTQRSRPMTTAAAFLLMTLPVLGLLAAVPTVLQAGTSAAARAEETVPVLNKAAVPPVIDGVLDDAVWKLAWPTMLQNIIGGMQGIVDHVMVGHYVGYTGNAAIGVSVQLWILVIVFVSSVFTGTEYAPSFWIAKCV